MVPTSRSPLRYLSFALPALLVAIAGLGAPEALAVPHSPHDHAAHHRALRSDLARRDTVATPAATSFVLDGLSGQAAQTRTYNFTISEMTGAPDGFSKEMLVVNG